MDKMALADRFEGYSKVFASESAFGIDLKAMADTLREMPEDSFAKVVNADFVEDKDSATQGFPQHQIAQPTLHRDRPGAPSSVPGGIAPTDPMFKDVPKGNKAKMISEISKKYNMDPEKVKSMLQEFVGNKEASEEVDAGLVTPGHNIAQPTLPSSRVAPAHTPGGITPTDPMFKDVPKGAKAKMISDIAKKRKLDPSMVQSIYDDFTVAVKEASSEEVESCGKKVASTESAWTKEAFDYVAQNLVRDVLGMEKSICCDTKRHLDKVQMPDAKKSPETKGAVTRQEDTGAALKPEQVPDLSVALESDMLKKSKGAVRKEAAAAVEETPEAKAAEPQEVKDAGKVKDPAKEIEKMQKEKAKKELEEKSRPKAEKEAEVEASAVVADKPAVEVESNTIVAEGIEFDGVIMDVDASDEDVKKLSALFE
jgi:hypothetical protein